MELERASRARESADILLNGGILPTRVESLRSESPQTPSSPKTAPLKSMTSAPQPGESLEEASHREASMLAEEVKRLRSQLQSATEKWSRDKQMFAEVSLKSKCLLNACRSSQTLVAMHAGSLRSDLCCKPQDYVDRGQKEAFFAYYTLDNGMQFSNALSRGALSDLYCTLSSQAALALQDARELQRVSRARDQLASQVSQLQ